MVDGGIIGECVFPKEAEDGEDSLDFYKRIALLPEQTHSLNVGIVKFAGEKFPHTDALVTFERDLPIGVVTADCVPILIYSSDAGGVGSVHAGWRGTLGGIVDNVLDVFEEHGASMSKLKVAFGPSISVAKYEVDESLADKFREAGFAESVFYPDGEGGRPHIDLQGVNVERLLRRGVLRENIRQHEGCTFNSANADGTMRYQSHRRSGGRPGRNLTLIRSVSSLIQP